MWGDDDGERGSELGRRGGGEEMKLASEEGPADGRRKWQASTLAKRSNRERSS